MVTVLLILLVALLTLLLALCLAGQAGAADFSSIYNSYDQERRHLIEVVETQLNLLDTSSVAAYLQNLQAELREELGPFDLKQMVVAPEGRRQFDLPSLLRRLASGLTREITHNTRLLGQLVLLAVFSALLKALASALPNPGAAETAFILVFITLFYLSLQSFRTAVGLAEEAVESMVGFMHAILPLMLTMLAAVGGVTTATVFQPLLFITVNTVATLTKNLIFPLILLSAVLSAVGSLSKEFPLKQLGGVVRQWSIILLGLLFIIFFGVLTIKGAIAPVSDGLTLKTIKFFTGTFVPVIGGRMAEAVEVVAGGSMLIKNTIGTFGLLTVFFITALPVLKICAILLIFRAATAAMEPISDSRLVEVMVALSNGLALVLAGVLTVGLMFFLTLTTLINLGNVTAFIR